MSGGHKFYPGVPDGTACILCGRVDPVGGLECGKQGPHCSSEADCTSIRRRRLINAAIDGED